MFFSFFAANPVLSQQFLEIFGASCLLLGVMITSNSPAYQHASSTSLTLPGLFTLAVYVQARCLGNVNEILGLRQEYVVGAF